MDIPLIELIINMNIELSQEQDKDLLLEKILKNAKKICNSNAGTLYLLEGNSVKMEILLNDQLNLFFGGAPVPTANYYQNLKPKAVNMSE